MFDRENPRPHKSHLYFFAFFDLLPVVVVVVVVCVIVGVVGVWVVCSGSEDLVDWAVVGFVDEPPLR